jgi:hypothetical protein
MAPDGPSDHQGEQPTLPQRTGPERSLRRRRLLSAQDWCQRATLENPRYKFRIKSGLQDGTLHPSIEKAILDIAWGKPQTLDKHLHRPAGTAIEAGAGQGHLEPWRRGARLIRVWPE